MPEFVELDWRGRPLRLEIARVGPAASAYPPVVFLHEGLGSVAAWKDFPERLCRTFGLSGLLYSRYGYGHSTPRPPAERWAPDFMHRQAWEVLPALLAALGLEKPWLFGHSDGASIALLHAARFPREVSGVIVAAPHIFVEEITLTGIRTARRAYLEQGLRERLAKYHADIDSAFWGWNDVWLEPAFRAWNIEAELAAITCPLLAVQGEDDEYGSPQQLYGIRRKAPQARLLLWPGCAHAPHRERPEALLRAAGSFITNRA